LAHIPDRTLIWREVTPRIVNPYTGNSSSLGIRKRLEEGFSDRKDFRKWLWLQLCAKRDNLDFGMDGKFAFRIIAHVQFHHGPERQCAAMFDDPRHMRSLRLLAPLRNRTPGPPPFSAMNLDPSIFPWRG
jgi:hypothetical protein